MDHQRPRGDQSPRAQRGGVYARHLLRALLSALVPGTGQILAGMRKRGYVMLGVVALLLILGGALALLGVDQVLSYLVQPRILLTLFALNLVLLAFRLFAVIDAYHARQSDSRRIAGTSILAADTGRVSLIRRSTAGIGLALLLLFTAAPHGIAGYYTFISHGLLTTVFASESDTEQTTATTAVASVPATVVEPTSTAGTAVAGDTPTSLTTSTTRTTSAPVLTTEPPATQSVPGLGWDNERRFTILLIGTDAGPGRRGARADSINVATIDLETGRVALFGIPRNTGDLPLGEKTAHALGTDVYPDMISNLYEEAQEHPELAPKKGDPGAVALRETASRLLGIPVDYYAVVDMGGLVDLIDAFGGITLNLKETLNIRLSPPKPGEEARIYDIPPGKQHLDGHEALAFARTRTGTSDYDRMRRQRCVLMALLHQNSVGKLALVFPKVVKVIGESVKTDIPLERLPDLVKVRGRLKTDEVIRVGFTPPDYIAGRNELGYNILDLKKVQATVRDIIENPEQVLKTQPFEVDTGDCWKTD